MPLELNKVSYAYGAGRSWEQQALADVALSVEPGELVLVVGPTGSGKSTLLRLAAGLLEPDAGSVSLDGQPISSAARGARVGIVFQNPESQLFSETVLDDVAFGPMNLGRPKPEALDVSRDALREVGLDPQGFADRSPFGLSGGEARRAALAGVLSMRPDYLLADEPTAGLDAAGRAAVKAIFAKLRTRAGVVVVTHDAEEFLDAADRVLVLLGGRSAFYGSVGQLLEAPEVFRQPGLRPPPLLEVQLRLCAAGLRLPGLSFDPTEVARGVADALASGQGCR